MLKAVGQSLGVRYLPEPAAAVEEKLPLPAAPAENQLICA
jgi:hypothetical protein